MKIKSRRKKSQRNRERNQSKRKQNKNKRKNHINNYDTIYSIIVNIEKSESEDYKQLDKIIGKNYTNSLYMDDLIYSKLGNIYEKFFPLRIKFLKTISYLKIKKLKELRNLN